MTHIRIKGRFITRQEQSRMLTKDIAQNATYGDSSPPHPHYQYFNMARRAAEARLSQQSECLQAILTGIAAAIAKMDLEGAKGDKPTEQEAEVMLEITKEAMDRFASGSPITDQSVEAELKRIDGEIRLFVRDNVFMSKHPCSKMYMAFLAGWDSFYNSFLQKKLTSTAGPC